jgi:tetratricopeptide (TPR) repeat protein
MAESQPVDALSSNEKSQKTKKKSVESKHLQTDNLNLKQEAKFVKAVEAIIQLSHQNDKFSPYTRAVFKAITYFDRRQDYSKVCRYCNCLNPDELEASPTSIIGENGKVIELASLKEQYLALLTKALIKTGDFEKCKEMCDRAFEKINTFHYDNDVWLKMRKAKALRGLQKEDEALLLFEQVLLQKDEWFISKEIAEVYASRNEFQKALQIAAKAALKPGEPEKKINLFAFIARQFANVNDLEKSVWHLGFTYFLRKKNGWAIAPSLEQEIESFDPNLLKKTSLKDLEIKLTAVWTDLVYAGQTKMTGTIHRLIDDNKRGFIKAQDGKSYFFHARSFKGSYKKLAEGLKVTFFLTDGYDKKHDRKTKNAEKIEECRNE